MNPAGDPLPLLRELKARLVGMDSIDILVAPPFTALHQTVFMFKDMPVMTGAQNLYWEEKGAFTGEISASMIVDTGATHVIIGHSERRQFFGETDKSVNLRVKAALVGGLIPVICVGETESERESGETNSVVEKQLTGALKGFDENSLESIVLAYEPVWAIGTGKVAQPEDAQDVHEFLRNLIREQYSSKMADSIRILYGGSVKPDNAHGLFKMPDIDGVLIGGASLSADSFAGIASAAILLS